MHIATEHRKLGTYHKRAAGTWSCFGMGLTRLLNLMSRLDVWIHGGQRFCNSVEMGTCQAIRMRFYMVRIHMSLVHG